MTCKCGGLVRIRHGDAGSEFMFLSVCAISRGAVVHEPYINGAGRRQGERASADTETAPASTPTNNPTNSPMQQPQQQQRQQPQMQQPMQQPTQPTQQEQEGGAPKHLDEKRGDAGVHGFWSRGRQAIFDVHITNTSSCSQRNTNPAKVLLRHEKEKQDKYRQACLERRRISIRSSTLSKGYLGETPKARRNDWHSF